MSANGLAYGYHMFMARMLAPGDYGALVTLSSISYVLAVFARTLQAWIIKAVSDGLNGSAGRVRAVFRSAMRSVLLLGSLLFLAHCLGSGWLADFLHLGTRTPVIVLGVYAVTSLLTPVPRGVLLGLNRLHLAGVIYPLESLARLAAGLVLLNWGLGVNGALAGYAFGELLAFLVALLPLRGILAAAGHQAESRSSIAVADRYSLFILTGNVLLMTMANMDQIAVKHYFSEEIAGNYAVAFLLGRIIILTTMALGWILFARAANVPVEDRRQVRLLLKGLLVTGVIALSVTVGYLVAPTTAIRLMGGRQYEIAHVYVGLVGIEMSLFAFVYIQVYYLMSLRQMQVVWPLILAFVSEVILLTQYHATVEQILLNLISVTVVLLVWVSGSCWSAVRANASLAATAVRPSPSSIADAT
jgi:O-antigen/teichoic acid export membrane protein